MFKVRTARLDEVDAIQSLMESSVSGLSDGFYDEPQTRSAAKYLTIPDRDIISDGTYFVVEDQGNLIACGGWSKRRKLFTGSTGQESLSDELLDPQTDFAKIRAFFVHPNYARKGLARLLHTHCQAEAQKLGFKGFELMATLPGVPLYTSLNYKPIGPQNLDLLDGTALPGLQMQLVFENS